MVSGTLGVVIIGTVGALLGHVYAERKGLSSENDFEQSLGEALFDRLFERRDVAERDVDELIMLPVFVDDALPSPPNPDAVRLDRRTSRGPRGVPRPARQP